MFIERKRIIDELECSLTESPIDATNDEVTQVAVEKNADGYISSRANFSKINEYSNDMEIYMEE